MASADLGSAEWERSKISPQDINLLKKLGIIKKQGALRFPSEESYPTPPMEYRVSFVDHLIRGLSTPIHNFLRGLLFVYGLQLHNLTPNSILHISIFITLFESFLGVQPNWALWKRIFLCHRNGSANVAYNIGGVIICVRPDVEYFDVKFPDSFQGWRKKWLYIHEENHGSVEDNIPPFDGAEKICRRRSWDAEATDEEKAATEALMTRIHELQSTRGQELSGIQITAYFLRIRVQPLQARKNPLWKYAGDKDVDRLSVDLPVKDLEKLVRKISSLNKKDHVPSSCRVKPYSATNALPKNHPDLVSLPPLPEGGEVEERAVVTDDNQGTSRPESEAAGSRKSAVSSEKEVESEATGSAHSPPPAVSPKNKRKRDEVVDSDPSKTGTPPAEEIVPTEKRTTFDPYTDALVSSDDEDEIQPIDATARTRKTCQEYELEDPGNDPLLDALSLLEIHGDEAHEGLAEAGAGLSRLYPYFFPKKKEPVPFLALAKCFNHQEDLGLKLRQEGLKVGVEGTIALVAESQQNIDWTRVGDTQEMETKKWQSLIKAAKPNSKKILAYLGCKPTPAPSSSKPEV
ncbi:hypothetical protein QYE76_014793 [Lolium multiflorum]|uniref:Transposase (putative) gypsy type domain-containing protein n=1 Tax=Lolium multiflorum TaxID=4521 RepID=A0AAD8U356_LOLMU|nr:hypothetical protein QYE76_014793 [Lolium multiflorum]